MVVHRTFLYDNEKSYSCSYSEINLKDIEKVDLELKYRNGKYEFELAYENDLPEKIFHARLFITTKVNGENCYVLIKENYKEYIPQVDITLDKYFLILEKGLFLCVYKILEFGKKGKTKLEFIYKKQHKPDPSIENNAIQ